MTDRFDYLHLSKNTLAPQDKEQRTVDNELLHEAMQLAHAGNVCDMIKRTIYYKDTNASERFAKQSGDIGTLEKSLPSPVAEPRELTQDETDLLHAGLGVGSEAGEIMEGIMKSIASQEPVDHVNMKEEVGDVLWYLAILARAGNFTLEDAMRTNIEKLAARYPDKFNTTDAVVRDLETERKVLASK